MPPFSKGTLGRIFIGATLFAGALIAHLKTGELGLIWAGNHEGVKLSTAKKDIIVNAKGTLEAPLTNLIINQAVPKEKIPLNLDPDDTFLPFMIEKANSDFKQLKEDFLDDPYYSDEEKFDFLEHFYEQHKNEIKYLTEFGSHQAFLDLMRTKAKSLIEKLQKDLGQQKDPLAILSLAEDIQKYLFHAGRVIDPESEFDETIFDEHLAEKVTGINGEKLAEYMDSLVLPAAQQALQNYRVGFASVAVTPKQIKENDRLSYSLGSSLKELNAILKQQKPRTLISAEEALGLTPQEIQQTKLYATPGQKPITPPSIGP